MALIKEIELENGITLTYHRIYNLNKIINMYNRIEVHSYINNIQREKEKTYQELQRKSIFDRENLTQEDRELLNTGINVLVEADFIELPYDADMTINDVYNYLKTLDKYSNAEDDE